MNGAFSKIRIWHALETIWACQAGKHVQEYSKEYLCSWFPLFHQKQTLLRQLQL